MNLFLCEAACNEDFSYRDCKLDKHEINTKLLFVLNLYLVVKLHAKLIRPKENGIFL